MLNTTVPEKMPTGIDRFKHYLYIMLAPIFNSKAACFSIKLKNIFGSELNYRFACLIKICYFSTLEPRLNE